MDSDENCKKEIRSVFDCVPPRGGTFLIAATADILADGLEADQIAVLGSFIVSLGDTLSYIAAQMVLNERIIAEHKEKMNGTPAVIP
jgi:hypothetical protein